MEQKNRLLENARLFKQAYLDASRKEFIS